MSGHGLDETDGTDEMDTDGQVRWSVVAMRLRAFSCRLERETRRWRMTVYAPTTSVAAIPHSMLAVGSFETFPDPIPHSVYL